MKRIGIVAAFPGELKPLVRGWQKRGHVFHGRIGDIESVAISGGMGTSAATRACELLIDEKVDALVSIGWAGSLSCGLKVGGSYAVREVIEASSGEHFSTDYREGYALITLDRVADTQEKRRLAQQYQAVLVDMEAAAVARVARAKGLGFLCFKAVSDGPNDKLPDFNRFTGKNGEWRMTPFLLYVGTRPRYWGPMRRLAKNSRAAAEKLAWFVPRCLLDSQ